MKLGTEAKVQMKLGGTIANIATTLDIDVNFDTEVLQLYFPMEDDIFSFWHDRYSEGDLHSYTMKFLETDIIWYFDSLVVRLESWADSLLVEMNLTRITQYAQGEDITLGVEEDKRRGQWVEL